MKYEYNSKTLTFKQVKTNNWAYFLLGIVLFSCISAGVTYKTTIEYIPIVYRAKSEVFNKEEFKQEIFNSNAKFPNIVWKQCVLESGNFTSPIFKEANNAFGMRISTQRQTLCIGEYAGFSEYRNLHESLGDYLLWQANYCKEIQTEEEYLVFLDKIYAPNQGYVEKLKQIK